MVRKLVFGMTFILLLALAAQALAGPGPDEAARREFFWTMAAMRLGLTDRQVAALKTELDSPFFTDLEQSLRPPRPDDVEAIPAEARIPRMVGHAGEILAKVTAGEPTLIASLLKAYALMDPTQRRIIAAHLAFDPPEPGRFHGRDEPRDDGPDDARGFRPRGPGPFGDFLPSAELRRSLAGHVRDNSLNEAVLKSAFDAWRAQAEKALKGLPEALRRRGAEPHGSRGPGGARKGK